MPHATSRSLDQTVAVITGATAGIGEATARTLVEAGVRVALGGRRRERLDALVEELGSDVAVAVAGDVRAASHSEELVAAAVEAWGRVDTVVANAGIGAYGGIMDLDDEQISDMVETNYTGTIWSARAAVRQFRAQEGGGDLVVVSSVAGFRGDGNEAVYAGTKFAQVGLAGSLDRELRGEGVRVTLICPAGTSTEFAIGHGRTEGSPNLDDYLRPEDVAHATRVVLEQPRSVRTTVWQLWSTAQSS